MPLGIIAKILLTKHLNTVISIPIPNIHWYLEVLRYFSRFSQHHDTVIVLFYGFINI